MIRGRTYMKEKINAWDSHWTINLRCYAHLWSLRRRPLDEEERRRFKDIVKRLEEGLYRAAHTKEDYMNLDTLGSCIHCLVNPRNRQDPQLVNSSPPIGTTIPTPDMSHGGNSTMIVASSVDTWMISANGPNSTAPTSINTGRVLPSSANGIHGPLSNGNH